MRKAAFFVFLLWQVSFARTCDFLITETFRGFVTGYSDRMVLAIHGGTSSMEKAHDMCMKVASILPEGFEVASLDFSPSALGGREVEEAVLMAKWLKEEKKVKTLGIVGISHGAYIGLMASLYVKPDFVIDMAGPTDMAEMYAHFRANPDLFKGWQKIIRETAQRCKSQGKSEDLCIQLLSPVNSAGFMDYPMLIIHGTEDRIVPLSQSLKLARKLLTFKNHRIWLFIFPSGHDVEFTKPPVESVIRAFIEWVGRGTNGMSGSDKDQKEHKALPRQTGGAGNHTQDSGGGTLGAVGQEQPTLEIRGDNGSGN